MDQEVHELGRKRGQAKLRFDIGAAMNFAFDRKTIGWLFLFFLMWSTTVAGAASSPLVRAKEEAEAKGYVFFATHDEIVAEAKNEGKLKVNTGLEKSNLAPLMKAFKQKYPFITDVYVEEITGLDAYQRFILELKSGQARQTRSWDIAQIPFDFAQEYMPYLAKYDVLGMAQQGVLKINPAMVHPVQRNIVGVTSSIRVVAYNTKLMAEDQLPSKWEDFLKPEFKGKKFIIDIRPLALAPLVPAWGLERTLDFARKLAAQQPVWVRGATRINTAIAAGEYSLFLGPSFSSIKRAMAKDVTGSLAYRIVEPIPTGVIDDAAAILSSADHPHAALLWFEFLASTEGQEIIDKYQPYEASIFTPGSAAEQVTRGKQLSVVDWNHASKFQDYMEKIIAASGFPKAEK